MDLNALHEYLKVSYMKKDMISAFLVLGNIQEGDEVMHVQLAHRTRINLFLSAS